MNGENGERNSLLCRYHMQNQGLSMVHSRKSKQFKRITNFNELQKPNVNSLVVQWLGFGVFIAGVWVQYLIRELRFYKPSGAGEKKKKCQIKGNSTWQQ